MPRKPKKQKRFYCKTPRAERYDPMTSPEFMDLRFPFVCNHCWKPYHPFALFKKGSRLDSEIPFTYTITRRPTTRFCSNECYTAYYYDNYELLPNQKGNQFSPHLRARVKICGGAPTMKFSSDRAKSYASQLLRVWKGKPIPVSFAPREITRIWGEKYLIPYLKCDTFTPEWPEKSSSSTPSSSDQSTSSRKLSEPLLPPPQRPSSPLE